MYPMTQLSSSLRASCAIAVLMCAMLGLSWLGKVSENHIRQSLAQLNAPSAQQHAA